MEGIHLVKPIFLTQGQIALVDNEDFDYLNQFNWAAQYNTKTKSYYAIRSKCCGYFDGKQKKKTLRMHRLIMDAEKGIEIDHINHDTLDNRKENLRIVTTRQNNQNRSGNFSSKYPGVSWNKRENKWRSYIRIGDKQKHLGYFKDEDKAFQAYKNALSNLGEVLIGD